MLWILHQSSPTYCELRSDRRVLDGHGGDPYSPGQFTDQRTIFTWWNGATTGIYYTVAKRGRFVGSDELGNRYFEARDDRDSYDRGRKRRWVIYKGYAD
eukprot:gene28961-50866_t